MYGVIYDDFLAHLIRRLDTLLQARPEPFTDGVNVSNKLSDTASRSVALTASPGGGTGDTVRTSYVTADVVTRDEGDAVDLINLVLALTTSRGPGGMVDGRPILYVAVNGGPNPDPAADGYFKQTAELELRHRGRNL